MGVITRRTPPYLGVSVGAAVGVAVGEAVGVAVGVDVDSGSPQLPKKIAATRTTIISEKIIRFISHSLLVSLVSA
jgi:hypothetical protein